MHGKKEMSDLWESDMGERITHKKRLGKILFQEMPEKKPAKREMGEL